MAFSRSSRRPVLPRAIHKELAVSILTVCGVLSTVGISYLVRRVPVFRHLVVAGETHFVFFVIYGLAISLIASASKVMRKRDTVILLLAATIIWVTFVEARQLLGMIRFLVFASLITLGVLLSDRAWLGSRGLLRVLAGALLPAVLCCAAGFIYYGLVAYFGHAQMTFSRELAVGSSWGFSLGLAVGLGLAMGGEVLRWMSRESS
jgi:hypothetical protein